VIAAAERGGRARYLSFTNLVEAFTLAAMPRGQRLELSPIREAMQRVEAALGIKRPLAQRAFKTGSVSLFVEDLASSAT